MKKKKLLEQHASDTALVEVLRQQSDNEQAVHAVEHHFLADEIAELEALAEFGKRLGFEPGRIHEQTGDKHRRFFFDLVSKTTTELPKLSRDALLMHALASAFDVTYDGWGTGIVRKPEPKKAANASKAAAIAKKKSR